MPKEAGRYFSFVKHHMFQLSLSCRQPLLAVLRSSPNAAEGCPPLGWSPALGYNAHSIGISFSINASSGETVPVQAVEATLTCPSIGKSMSPTERNKIHRRSLTEQGIQGPFRVPYANLETFPVSFINICEPCPCQCAREHSCDLGQDNWWP